MLTLTSAQEAALNAAQEVLVELSQQMKMDKATSASLSLSYFPCWSKGKEFYAHFPDPRKPNSSVDGIASPSFAVAVAAALAKQEEVASEPAKLTTAREAIDAIKKHLAENPFGVTPTGSVEQFLDALPIA